MVHQLPLRTIRSTQALSASHPVVDPIHAIAAIDETGGAMSMVRGATGAGLPVPTAASPMGPAAARDAVA